MTAWIEEIVRGQLESYLGKYLEVEELGLKLFSGQLDVPNVFLKETAFTELRLPVKVYHGKICRLKVSAVLITLCDWNLAQELRSINRSFV